MANAAPEASICPHLTDVGGAVSFCHAIARYFWTKGGKLGLCRKMVGRNFGDVCVNRHKIKAEQK